MRTRNWKLKFMKLAAAIHFYFKLLKLSIPTLSELVAFTSSLSATHA
jgi:hypothetical protein